MNDNIEDKFDDIIGSAGTDELVWVDTINHECHLLVNELDSHNRPFPEFDRITQLVNPNLRGYIEKIHSNQYELQLKYIFIMGREMVKGREQGEDIPSDESVLAELETYKMQSVRMLEFMEENEVSFEGKFMGYGGMLKMKGDRILQYNHYKHFLPDMPSRLIVLRKMLEFYVDVYPLRVKHAEKIKDYVAEINNLYICMDSNYKIVTDVVLLPLIMKNDDEHAMNISIPVEVSEFGVDIEGFHSDQFLSAKLVDTPFQPPKLCLSEFSVKELRGILVLLLEICLDRSACQKVVEFANKIYALVAAGLTVSRRKIEILMDAYEVEKQSLTLDIIEVILDITMSEKDFSQRVRKMIEIVKRYEQDP